MVEIDHGFSTDMKYAVTGTFTGGLSSKIYLALKDGWFNVKKVYPVTSEKQEVDGDKAYNSIRDLPEIVDVIVIVHKRDKAVEILNEIIDMDPKPSVWFMPRTLVNETKEIVDKYNIFYAESCIMGHMKREGNFNFLNLHNIHSYFSKWNKIEKQT